VHQQIVGEPLKVLELDGAFDIIARVHGGGPSARPVLSASASRGRSTRLTKRPTAPR
jgi:ribosomal protein S9